MNLLRKTQSKSSGQRSYRLQRTSQCKEAVFVPPAFLAVQAEIRFFAGFADLRGCRMKVSR
jgi:hypothetical protein